MPKSPELYWLDLETTGLKANRERILEVAVARATLESPFKVEHIYHEVLHLSRNERDSLDPFILSMHTRNGLLEECHKSTTTITEVEEALYCMIPNVPNREELPILAGSTVHYDNDFLRKHMPTIAGRFSHRHYDVSAIKLFCQSLGMAKIPKGEAHRVKDDIEESIKHAMQCAAWLLVQGVPQAKV